MGDSHNRGKVISVLQKKVGGTEGEKKGWFKKRAHYPSIGKGGTLKGANFII